jgi:hypothetical protein
LGILPGAVRRKSSRNSTATTRWILAGRPLAPPFEEAVELVQSDAHAIKGLALDIGAQRGFGPADRLQR